MYQVKAIDLDGVVFQGADLNTDRYEGKLVIKIEHKDLEANFKKFFEGKEDHLVEAILRTTHYKRTRVCSIEHCIKFVFFLRWARIC